MNISRVWRQATVVAVLLFTTSACATGTETAANSIQTTNASTRVKNAVLIPRRTLASFNGCDFVFDDFSLQYCKPMKNEVHQYFANGYAISQKFSKSSETGTGLNSILINPPLGTVYMLTTIDFVDGSRITDLQIPIAKEISTAAQYKYSALAPLTGRMTQKGWPQTAVLNGCEFGYLPFSLKVCKGFVSETHYFLRDQMPITPEQGSSIGNGNTNDVIQVLAPPAANGVALSINFGDGTKMKVVVPLVPYNSPLATFPPASTTTVPQKFTDIQSAVKSLLTPTTTTTTVTPVVQPTVAPTPNSQCIAIAKADVIGFCKKFVRVTFYFLSGTKAISPNTSVTSRLGSPSIKWNAPVGATTAKLSVEFLDRTTISNFSVPLDGNPVYLPVRP